MCKLKLLLDWKVVTAYWGWASGQGAKIGALKVVWWEAPPWLYLGWGGVVQCPGPWSVLVSWFHFALVYVPWLEAGLGLQVLEPHCWGGCAPCQVFISGHMLAVAVSSLAHGRALLSWSNSFLKVCRHWLAFPPLLPDSLWFFLFNLICRRAVLIVFRLFSARVEISPLPGIISPVAGYYIGGIWLLKGQCFVLSERDTYSGYRFAFPTCSASSVKNTIWGLAGALFTITVFHTTCFWWKNSAQGVKCACEQMLIEFPDHSMFPVILKQLTSLEWTFEGRMVVSARWQYLDVLAWCSPGGCMCSKSAFSMQHWFSHSWDTWVQESRVDESGPLTIAAITPTDPLAEFCYMSMLSLWSAVLEA